MAELYHGKGLTSDPWAIAAGITSETYTDFWFYAKTRARAESLRPALESMGFHVWIDKPEDSDHRVIATKVGLMDFCVMRPKFEALAKRCKATYDGWEMTMGEYPGSELAKLGLSDAERRSC